MSRLGIPDELAAPSEIPWKPESQAECDAVRQQLDRILSHTSFRNSKRYPTLLRYVVDQTLTGETSLKERVLGVEVFGRAPDYDTNDDPIVRITAGEIRRRIAQYYHEPGHEGELRIDLPSGSYVPVFQLSVQVEMAAATPISSLALSAAAANGVAAGQTEIEIADASALRGRALVQEISLESAAAAGAEVEGDRQANRPVESATISSAPNAEKMSKWLLISFVAIPAALICGIIWIVAARGNALDRFWAPVVSDKVPVLICIPDLNSNSAAFEPPKNATPDEFNQALFALGPEYRREKVSLGDSMTLALIAQLLGSKNVDFRVRRSEDATLEDLKDGPVVLIAGGNNQWTVQLNKQLRFTAARDGQTRYIRDALNPTSEQWSVTGSDLTPNPADYAIISRVFDSNTGGVLVTAAGLHHTATQSAGECITDARCLAEAEKMAPGDWSKANIQIVIETKVIGETPGQPSVVAARVW